MKGCIRRGTNNNNCSFGGAGVVFAYRGSCVLHHVKFKGEASGQNRLFVLLVVVIPAIVGLIEGRETSSYVKAIYSGHRYLQKTHGLYGDLTIKTTPNEFKFFPRLSMSTLRVVFY